MVSFPITAHAFLLDRDTMQFQRATRREVFPLPSSNLFSANVEARSFDQSDKQTDKSKGSASHCVCGKCAYFAAPCSWSKVASSKALTSSTDKPTRTKALLAIAFAGSMLTSQLPALGQESPKGSASAIEGIAKSVRGTPEEKAYYLLQLAYCYITGGNAAALETQFKSGLGQLGNSNMFRFSPRGEHPLVSWANRVSLLSHSAGTIAPIEIGKKRISSEDRAVADKAIEAAIAQLGKAFKNIETLNLYLIASGLSRMTGNIPNVQKCNKVLNEAIQACETKKTVDSAQIKLISSILNSMAYVFIPIEIEDFPMQSRRRLPVFDMKNFDRSERLKLRAAALLDRLPVTDHDRRKAHRDLTLWYTQLGKGERALKEKQELFNLVGVEEDSILYPQQRTCGGEVWWTVEKKSGPRFCGMG